MSPAAISDYESEFVNCPVWDQPASVEGMTLLAAIVLLDEQLTLLPYRSRAYVIVHNARYHLVHQFCLEAGLPTRPDRRST